MVNGIKLFQSDKPPNKYFSIVKVYFSFHLLIIINRLLQSVSLCPKVMPLSGAFCTYFCDILFIWLFSTDPAHLQLFFYVFTRNKRDLINSEGIRKFFEFVTSRYSLVRLMFPKFHLRQFWEQKPIIIPL